MLCISGLNYHYGKVPVLRDIALTLSAGEVVCLIGPNGAGKSTLLKCINRILKPSARSVLLNERASETYGRRELARTIAYVPQQTGSSMSLRVIEMVALGRAPHRGFTTKAVDQAIIWGALERLNLAAAAFRPFGDLSGGERQRVLIARALAQEGRLLLMDEPTSNLDPHYQLETLSLIREIAAERNIATLVALHDLSFAARLADSIIMMSEGKVHASGEWQDVLTPSNLERTYGVSAIIGSDKGYPYVIPIHSEHR